MKSCWLRFSVLCLCMTASSALAGEPPQANLASIPATMQECELNGCESGVKGTFTFNGREGIARWSNGGIAKLTVERFDNEAVVIHRVDEPGTLGAGITATYRGTIHGDRVDGTITWSFRGGPPSTGKWSVKFAESSAQSNAQSTTQSATQSPQQGATDTAGTKGDPNIPYPGTDMGVTSGAPDFITHVSVTYHSPKVLADPEVIFYFGQVPHFMAYWGYNDEGSWFTADDKVYTLKGNVVTNRDIEFSQTPKGLRNASEVYLARIDPETEKGPVVASNNSGAGGSPRHQTSRQVDTARAKGDPYMGAGGDINVVNPLAPDYITRVVISFPGQDPSSTNPDVTFFFGQVMHAMRYLGYNDEGSWFAGDDKVYTLKGNVVTNRNLEFLQTPKGLKNPSKTYLARIDPETEKSPVVASNNSGAGGSPRHQTSGQVDTARAKGDPYLGAGGDISIFNTAAPDYITSVTIRFSNGDPTSTNPQVLFYFGQVPHPMRYLGYNDEGSWFAGNNILYTLKGNNVTNRKMEFLQAPKGLKNPSETYLARIDPETEKGPVAASKAGDGAGRPAKPAATPNRAAPQLGRAGMYGKVEFHPGATTVHYVDTKGNAHSWTFDDVITLTYKDLQGNTHSYRVVPPYFVRMTPANRKYIGLNEIGEWIYVADDGRSGIHFHVYVAFDPGNPSNPAGMPAPENRRLGVQTFPLAGAALGGMILGYGADY